jgi:hypothetical protein
MAATPKAKPPTSRATTARADRTSSVVTATLILLTALGVVTVFWEPLAALAVGNAGTAPAGEPVSESHATAADAGAVAPVSPTAGGARDAGGSS